MGDIVPRDELTKYGVRTIGGIGGSIVTGIIHAITSGPILAIVIGGAAIFGGISMMKSQDESDHKPGSCLVIAGALIAVSCIPVLGGITSFILGFGGLALLGYGIYNGVKFIKGLLSK